MKGIIIYETPGWGDEDNVVYTQEVNNASYTLKQVGSDPITCYFEGIVTNDPVTKATCNESDTYDFETGALIALMKLCGREKALKAVEELYSLYEPKGCDLDGDIFKNELQKTTDCLNDLSKRYDEVIKYCDTLRESNKRLQEENKSLKKAICAKGDTDALEALRGFKPTKREQMWRTIIKSHKESDVIIEVKREYVSTFLHEIEDKIPEITWASGVKIFETKYTIKDIYEELKTHDTIYFRLSKETKLSYSSDPNTYRYIDLEHISYLPPMRWDLFEKGRLAVGVRKEHYSDFSNKVSSNFDKVIINHFGESFNYNFFIFDKDNKIIKRVGQSQFRQLKEICGRKVYYWEDVR